MSRMPGPERLSAFSDGVIAVIITIMVLELKVPHEPTLAAVLALWPILISYALSYLVLALIWINHHHLVHHTSLARPAVLWTNLLLLFFVSLIPFFTEYMASTRLAPIPTALYAGNFLLVAVAFMLFEREVARQIDPADLATLADRARADRRNKFTLVLYAVATGAAFSHSTLSLVLILLNAALYIVPEAKRPRSRHRADTQLPGGAPPPVE